MGREQPISLGCYRRHELTVELSFVVRSHAGRLPQDNEGLAPRERERARAADRAFTGLGRPRVAQGSLPGYPHWPQALHALEQQSPALRHAASHQHPPAFPPHVLAPHEAAVDPVWHT